jgi:hypothetical protein
MGPERNFYCEVTAVYVLTPALPGTEAQWIGVYADGDLAADWGTVHVAADHPLPAPTGRAQRFAATANGRPVEVLFWGTGDHRGAVYYVADGPARRRARRALRARRRVG